MTNPNNEIQSDREVAAQMTRLLLAPTVGDIGFVTPEELVVTPELRMLSEPPFRAAVLQQKWIHNGAEEWRDIPSVTLPRKQAGEA